MASCLKGGHPIYVGGDENSQRWIKDFKQQMVAVPEKLENVDGMCRVCVCVFMLAATSVHVIILFSHPICGTDDTELPRGSV